MFFPGARPGCTLGAGLLFARRRDLIVAHKTSNGFAAAYLPCVMTGTIRKQPFKARMP